MVFSTPKPRSITGCKHVAQKPEADGRHHGVEDILDDDVGGVLGSNRSSLKEGKTSLEEENYNAVDEDEKHINALV